MLNWTRDCTVLEISLFQGTNDVQMLSFKKEGILDILRIPFTQGKPRLLRIWGVNQAEQNRVEMGT